MPSRKSVIIGALAALALYLAYTFYKRRQINTDQFFAPQTKTAIALQPYSGRYAGSPLVQDFIRRFPDMARASTGRVRSTTGLSEPPVATDIILDDTYESDPYRVPCASTTCTPVDNPTKCTVRLGAKAIADNYRGRTKPDTILTHEMTHVFLLSHVPDHNNAPKWFIEGLPIHVAGQRDEIRRAQSLPPISNPNYNYNPGEIHVDEYAELADEFYRRYQ